MPTNRRALALKDEGPQIRWTLWMIVQVIPSGTVAEAAGVVDEGYGMWSILGL